MKPLTIKLMVLAIGFVFASVLPADAENAGSGGNNTGAVDWNANVPRGSQSMARVTEMWSKKYPPAARFSLDRSFPEGRINAGEPDGMKVIGTTGGVVWPELMPPAPVKGGQRLGARMDAMADITGFRDPQVAPFPLTANFAAVVMATSGQMEVQAESGPQNAVERAKAEADEANVNSADTAGNIARMNAGSAIDFSGTYLYNFTVDDGNRWNRVRNELFLPMAILILLPGAVLSQVKAIVSAGTPVFGSQDVSSPFEGIQRSIIAIFMIPATYLVVNYGIDVANSITFTIADEYERIFGSSMYRDAMCMEVRGIPVRNPSENRNYIPNETSDMGMLGNSPGINGGGPTPFARFEGDNIEVKLQDPCAGLNEVPEDRANESTSFEVHAMRNLFNTTNAGLAMSWNILCAFQIAYLYYLWFTGPIVAALWVYPMSQLRAALPNWVGGVVTICFWSLFWNTVVLLMACLRGVDETGTLMLTALNFLATLSVKTAFDFGALAREAGGEAMKMGSQMGQAAQGGHGSGGGHGAQHGQQGGQHGQQAAHAQAAREHVLGGNGVGAGSGRDGGSTVTADARGGAAAGVEGAAGRTGGHLGTGAGEGVRSVSPLDFPAPPTSGGSDSRSPIIPASFGSGEGLPFLGRVGGAEGVGGVHGHAGLQAAFHGLTVNGGDTNVHAPVHLSAAQMHALMHPHNADGSLNHNARAIAEQVAAAGSARFESGSMGTAISAAALAAGNLPQDVADVMSNFDIDVHDVDVATTGDNVDINTTVAAAQVGGGGVSTTPVNGNNAPPSSNPGTLARDVIPTGADASGVPLTSAAAAAAAAGVRTEAAAHAKEAAAAHVAEARAAQQGRAAEAQQAHQHQTQQQQQQQQQQQRDYAVASAATAAGGAAGAAGAAGVAAGAGANVVSDFAKSMAKEAGAPDVIAAAGSTDISGIGAAAGITAAAGTVGGSAPAPAPAPFDANSPTRASMASSTASGDGAPPVSGAGTTGNAGGTSFAKLMGDEVASGYKSWENRVADVGAGQGRDVARNAIDGTAGGARDWTANVTGAPSAPPTTLASASAGVDAASSASAVGPVAPATGGAGSSTAAGAGTASGTASGQPNAGDAMRADQVSQFAKMFAPPEVIGAAGSTTNAGGNTYQYGTDYTTLAGSSIGGSGSSGTTVSGTTSEQAKAAAPSGSDTTAVAVNQTGTTAAAAAAASGTGSNDATGAGSGTAGRFDANAHLAKEIDKNYQEFNNGVAAVGAKMAELQTRNAVDGANAAHGPLEGRLTGHAGAHVQGAADGGSVHVQGAGAAGGASAPAAGRTEYTYAQASAPSAPAVSGRADGATNNAAGTTTGGGGSELAKAQLTELADTIGDAPKVLGGGGQPIGSDTSGSGAGSVGSSYMAMGSYGSAAGAGSAASAGFNFTSDGGSVPLTGAPKVIADAGAGSTGAASGAPTGAGPVNHVTIDAGSSSTLASASAGGTSALAAALGLGGSTVLGGGSGDNTGVVGKRIADNYEAHKEAMMKRGEEQASAQVRGALENSQRGGPLENVVTGHASAGTAGGSIGAGSAGSATSFSAQSLSASADVHSVSGASGASASGVAGSTRHFDGSAPPSVPTHVAHAGAGAAHHAGAQPAGAHQQQHMQAGIGGTTDLAKAELQKLADAIGDVPDGISASPSAVGSTAPSVGTASISGQTLAAASAEAAAASTAAVGAAGSALAAANAAQAADPGAAQVPLTGASATYGAATVSGGAPVPGDAASQRTIQVSDAGNSTPAPATPNHAMQALQEAAGSAIGSIIASNYEGWENKVTDSSASISHQVNSAVENTHVAAHQSLGDQITHNVTNQAAPPTDYAKGSAQGAPMAAASALTQALGGAASGQVMPTIPAIAPAMLDGQRPNATPPDASRFGNVARTRDEALNMVQNSNGQTPSRGAVGPTKVVVAGTQAPAGRGASTSKLGSALGRANSATGKLPLGARKDGKPPMTSKPARSRTVKDPMGEVATGTTLRRWRQKRQMTPEETAAMEKLGTMTIE